MNCATNESLQDMSFYKFIDLSNMFMVDSLDKLKELYLSFLKNKYGLDVFDLELEMENNEVKIKPKNIATTLAISDLFNKYKKSIPAKHYKDTYFKNKYIEINGNNIKVRK